MQGMQFVCLDDKSQIVNSGHIISQITPERYLCQFLRAPTMCRVCRLEEIEGWNLFPNTEQAKAFVEALKPKPEKTKKELEELQKNSAEIARTKELIRQKKAAIKKKTAELAKKNGAKKNVKK